MRARTTRWLMGVGLLVALTSCDRPRPPVPTGPRPAQAPEAPTASVETNPIPPAPPPPATAPEPVSATAASAPAPCPADIQAELDQLATCFRQAVTTLQREPEAQPLGVFLRQASLSGHCAAIAQNAAGAVVVAGQAVGVDRTESHDNYGEGHVAFLLTYRFSVAHCRHTATTTIDRHIGGRP